MDMPESEVGMIHGGLNKGDRSNSRGL